MIINWQLFCKFFLIIIIFKKANYAGRVENNKLSYAGQVDVFAVLRGFAPQPPRLFAIPTDISTISTSVFIINMLSNTKWLVRLKEHGTSSRWRSLSFFNFFWGGDKVQATDVLGTHWLSTDLKTLLY